MNRFRGFTIIEILVVVAILAILASATVPFAEFAYIRDREEELQGNLKEIRGAIARWRGDCEKALKKAYGKDGLQAVLDIPEPLLFPPDIGALTKKDDYKIEGTFNSTVYNFTFKHRVYLETIPNDPFVGAPAWTQYYASGTVGGTTTFWAGTIAEDVVGILDISSGVFDIGAIADNNVIGGTNSRKGFVTSMSGSKYSDW